MICEMEECAQLAQGYVEAQWTAVDFVRYESCFQHIPDMRLVLTRRRVDGELPVFVRYGFYDPERE
jgi:hypothetical protein